MAREGSRFLSRIQGTKLFLGEKSQTSTLDALGFAPLFDQQALKAMGVSSGDTGSIDLDLGAQPAMVGELLDALDLPEDDEDPPELETDALESLDPPTLGPESLELELELAEPDPPDPPSKIVRGASLPTPVASGDDSDRSTFDAPYALPKLELYTEAKEAAPLLSPIEPEPLGASSDWDPGSGTPMDPAKIEAQEPELDALRKENALLKSYVEVLVETISASNLPLPSLPDPSTKPMIAAILPTEPPAPDHASPDPPRVVPRPRGRRPMPRR
jgi:hypothetical protein